VMIGAFAMSSAYFDGQETATSGFYRALLAVSGAIVSHGDLPALFHEVAGLLHLVRFDYPTLFLHAAARSAPRVAPALPEWRFQCGASRLFPNMPRSNVSATRYRPLPCEETHRRQPRRHGPCFRGVQV